MKIREEIKLSDFLWGVIIKMSEGNPGAQTVLTNILNEFEKTQEEAFILYLILDDMNIRGIQIWIGYKEYCKCDIDKFVQCIKDHDEEMIAEINRWGEKGNYDWLAVKAGSSVTGRRTILRH